MSRSLYLYCPDTKQAVHVAEASSGWFRGGDYSDAVGAFCFAHEGKPLLTAFSDGFEDFIDYDVWTDANAPAAYRALVGSELRGYAPHTAGSGAKQEPPR